MKTLLAASLLLALSVPVSAQTTKSRRDFDKLVKTTYNFNQSRLNNQNMAAIEKSVDRFWNLVKKNRREYLPLLRTDIQNPKSNAFFRYDGANLLVAIDPSLASKKLLVEIYTITDLDIVGPRRWLETMAQMGKEGFDTSPAAVRWLSDPKALYLLPEHGDYKIDSFVGALILFGSMNEEKATPALIKIVKDVKNARREAALSILADQATPAALKTIEALDINTLSPRFQEIVENYRTYPNRVQPRSKPLTTRPEFLRAFQEFVQGKPARFQALIEKVNDGERDVVSVMKPEDLPLLRRVRRTFMAGANPHAISYYNSFTDILMHLVGKG